MRIEIMPANTATSLNLLAAIEGAEELIAQMDLRRRADPARRARYFAQTYDALSALPGLLPPQFLRNFARWPSMWAAGEYEAARWQLDQLAKKLRLFVLDWQDMEIPVEADAGAGI